MDLPARWWWNPTAETEAALAAQLAACRHRRRVRRMVEDAAFGRAEIARERQEKGDEAAEALRAEALAVWRELSGRGDEC